jgi:hypothetical protein
MYMKKKLDGILSLPLLDEATQQRYSCIKGSWSALSATAGAFIKITGQLQATKARLETIDIQLHHYICHDSGEASFIMFINGVVEVRGGCYNAASKHVTVFKFHVRKIKETSLREYLGLFGSKEQKT